MDAFEAISLPELRTPTARKMFTPAEANRALVLVRRIVRDIVADYRRLRELHDSYQALHHEGDATNDHEGDATKAERARQEYVAITDHLAELREELDAIGCELKDFEVGLVDFPARRNDSSGGEREVCLCWQLGEPAVTHWHKLTTGFGGRRPID